MNDTEFNVVLQRQLEEWTAEHAELLSRTVALEKRIEAARTLLNGASSTHSTPSVPENESFSARIRRTLRRLGEATPKQVAEALKTEGFTWDRKTELATSVNADLYRQSKSPSVGVQRRGRGHYRATDVRGDK